MTASSTHALQADYELHWYKIRDVLGQGAFGITYLAYDINLEREVAIKEYLPDQFASRDSDLSVRPTTNEHKEDFEWGLERFISEARTLTRFEHPNLVKVFNIFEMNNTAYMVMNYELGKSLQQILKGKKTLTELEIGKILNPLISGIEIMHGQGFVHRDIKPGNIFIRTDGSPVLLDFGSARQTRSALGRNDHDEPKTLTTLVSPGYAPIEQYGSKSDRQGPWTDIYGLGATLYRAIVGVMPISALDRSEAILHDRQDPYISLASMLKDRYPASFLAAIDHAMAFKTNDRPQTMVEWRNEFELGEIDNDKVTETNIQMDLTDSPTVKIGPSEEATFDLSAQETIKTEALDTEVRTTQKLTKRNTAHIRTKHKLLIGVVSGVLIISGVLFFMKTEEDASSTATTQASSPIKTMEKNEAIQTQIVQLLTLAKDDINALRLTSPKDNNAFDKYLSILALDGNNQAAKSGIQAITNKYIDMAYSAINSNKINHADSYLKKATAITPNSDEIAMAQQALNQKRAELATAGKLQTEAAEKDPEESNEGFWSTVKKWHKKETEKSKQVKNPEDKSMEDMIKKSL